MSGFSSEKLNSRRSLLSILFVLLTAVFSVNLALATDLMIFMGFYIIAASVSAFLMTASSPFLALASSLAGWAAALMITKDPLCAILSVSYLPFSLTIPRIGKDKLSRSGAVGIGSACITLAAVAILLYVTYVRAGELSLSAIRRAFPFFFGQITELLYESFYIKVAGSEVSLIAQSNVGGYLNVIICLIPAAISAVMTFVGYIVAFIFKKLVEITAAKKVDRKAWLLVPSPVTAVFFLIALITVTVLDNVNLVSLTALNFFVILLPTILLTGLLTSLSPIITNGIPRPRLLRPLTLIISVFNGIVPFASLCIFYGLFDAFKASSSKRKPKKQE